MANEHVTHVIWIDAVNRLDCERPVNNLTMMELLLVCWSSVVGVPWGHPTNTKPTQSMVSHLNNTQTRAVLSVLQYHWTKHVKHALEACLAWSTTCNREESMDFCVSSLLSFGRFIGGAERDCLNKSAKTSTDSDATL
mgnify:CR=1 FL=1